MTTRLTDADLAEIARLYAVATTPLNDPDADQDARVDHSLARIRAEVKLEETDAIGRLLAELSATRRERDEAYRTADQLREGVRGLEEENSELRERLAEADDTTKTLRFEVGQLIEREADASKRARDAEHAVKRLRVELDARNAEVEALMDRLADVAPSDEEVAE